MRRVLKVNAFNYLDLNDIKDFVSLVFAPVVFPARLDLVHYFSQS